MSGVERQLPDGAERHLPDGAARTDIDSELDTNILVEAGAGSGSGSGSGSGCARGNCGTPPNGGYNISCSGSGLANSTTLFVCIFCSIIFLILNFVIDFSTNYLVVVSFKSKGYYSVWIDLCDPYD